jgi:hypothetical protein
LRFFVEKPTKRKTKKIVTHAFALLLTITQSIGASRSLSFWKSCH